MSAEVLLKERVYIVSRVLLVCAFLFLCAGCRDDGRSQDKQVEFEIDRLYERGPLTVHLRLDRDKISIAGTLLLEFETAIESGYAVEMPSLDEVHANFGIIDREKLPSRLDAENRVVTTYRYRIEPFLSGNYQLPAFTFGCADVNVPVEKKYSLLTEAVDIEVTSILGKRRGRLEISDIEGVVDLPGGSSFWWLWMIFILVIVGALTGYLYLMRRRQDELVRIFRSAHEIAYERLRALVRQKLIDAGRIKRFYERLSDILRHYIEDRFDLRAPEMTTEEFLIELHNTDVLSDAHKKDVGKFLEHCDLVKFARYNPDKRQIQQTFNLVKYFIEKTKSDERKIDVTERCGAAVGS